jgi:dihydrofolate synthase/folylpolyglutamate synthase
MLTYHDTLDFLYRLEIARMDLKLERVVAALRLCGSPEQRFPTLHIAGTNGKGSTAALLHAVLTTAGYRTGLFTSPHLIDFCERIRVGQRCISEAEVVEGVATIRTRIETAGIHLTPFEMMTVLAFSTFARAQVEMAVVEVGLGGRLDATNVLHPLVAVITSIGLDHQAFLGSTIAEIAREKGGIIKPHTPTVIGQVDDESLAVLREVARARGSQAYCYSEAFSSQGNPEGSFDYHGLQWRFSHLPLGLRGTVQWRNAAVALAALELIQTHFPITEIQVRYGLRAARWPGRFEVVSRNPFVLLDGAHNPQAMALLIDELPTLVQGRRVKLLFGVMRDKDWKTMVPLLARVVVEVVITRVQQGRAEDPAILRQAFAPYCPVRVIADARMACQQLMAEASADEAVVVCGSLFLIGEVYPLFSPTAGLQGVPLLTAQGKEAME